MCSFGKTLLAFALLHFAFQGQICLLLQVALNILLLPSCISFSAPSLVFLTVYRLSIVGCKKNHQSDFSIDHLVMPMCRVISVLLEEGVCYDQCVLLATLLAFALLHFVL